MHPQPLISIVNKWNDDPERMHFHYANLCMANRISLLLTILTLYEYFPYSSFFFALAIYIFLSGKITSGLQVKLDDKKFFFLPMDSTGYYHNVIYCDENALNPAFLLSNGLESVILVLSHRQGCVAGRMI